MPPRTAAKRAKPSKPPRPPVAIKRLADALELVDEAAQCAALHIALAKVAKAKHAETAAAALAHTSNGKPIARAYLTVIATPGDDPVTGADAIAKYCAAIDRGRKAMRGAFTATWQRASDVRALEDAYRNLAKEILDDPELLAAGVEAAKKVGNGGALADRTLRYERAKHFAPVVKALAGNGAARTKAVKQLAGMTADDRRHIHARILDTPQAFSKELAVEAVVALVDDPQTPDLSLTVAIADVRDHALPELLEVWRTRVAAGDDALVNRLAALFEWTSLSATDIAQLAPFVRVLRLAGRQRAVYALLDGALTSENPTVREAVLRDWLGEPEGLAALSDPQIDTLMRSVIAIAEEGHDTPDRKAANQLLQTASHPAARKPLMDAIEGSKTKRNDQLRTNLYRGLAQITHDSVSAFLINRLFGEREAYDGLIDALAGRLGAQIHRDVLAVLAARTRDPDVVHAATAYAEILVEKRPSPRLLVDLARALIATLPKTRDDGRRLRYLFEQATAAAIGVRALDAARTFVTRARDLPDNPYSDYRVIDRGLKTPAAFTDESLKAQIAALDSGELEMQLAAARAATDAARKGGKPAPADDARLAVLAGAAVAQRLLDDRDTCVVWFYDELGEPLVYDGFGVAPPTFTLKGDPHAGMSATELTAFVGGKTIIDERVTCCDAGFTRVREVIRIGDRILVFDGGSQAGRAPLRVLGVKLAGYIAARDATARFAASPPEGMKRTDPWTRKGGVIYREYLSGAGSTARLAVVGGKIHGATDNRFPALERGHADAAAAGKAIQAWEGKLFAAGGRLVALALEAG